ncbi:MAG: hypothetical protein HZB55_23725 [Deltaproteobacteria bacterium]|nr:hypothetical protein [Deltaproteobacteria bacterium]
MTALDLLRDLEAQGFLLEARGERLHVEAPAGTLTPELRANLTEHKPTLLRLLQGGKGHAPERLPYLDQRDDLVIPFEADPSHHWWKPDGRSLRETLAGMGAGPEVLRLYVPPWLFASDAKPTIH